MNLIHETTSPVITEYDAQGFTVDGQRFDGSIVIIGKDGAGYAIGTVAGDTISAASLAPLQNLVPMPHLAVIGVGLRFTHPHFELRQELGRMGLPAEIVATDAACRTWNLLLAEGRKVAFLAAPASREAKDAR